MTVPTVGIRHPARTWWRTAAVVGAALVLAGCGGTAPGAADRPSATTSATAPFAAPSELLDPAAFAREVTGGERFVVNVHTPDEGAIAGTDAAIPFDELIERVGELPEDTSTPLAVYCRSASMSAKASASLAAMGYSDIVELAGGMKAWSADGRGLLPSS